MIGWFVGRPGTCMQESQLRSIRAMWNLNLEGRREKLERGTL